MTFLLNTIEADRKETFYLDDWPKLQVAIESGRRRLQEIGAPVSRIKRKRDRDLAHLDRCHINATEDSQAVEVAELRQVFDAIDEIGRDLMASNAALAQWRDFRLPQLPRFERKVTGDTLAGRDLAARRLPFSGLYPPPMP
jgi:hypothetical protein